MYSLLLALIYIAFISLGLPDPLIGASWPVMHESLGVSVASMGIVTMVIAAGTVLSSLFSVFFQPFYSFYRFFILIPCFCVLFCRSLSFYFFRSFTNV